MQLNRLRHNLLILVFALALAFGLTGFASPSARAVTTRNILTYCDRVVVSGTTTLEAPYVRITVNLASQLTTMLAQRVIWVQQVAGKRFRVMVSFRRQRPGTHLIISVGEWDGNNYLQPATLSGTDCLQLDSQQFAPAPTPVLAPPQPLMPQIVSFTAMVKVCMDHVPCIYLAWMTLDATHVSVESGHVTNDVFKPGGWYSDSDLPPIGVGGFMPKIDNDAVRLCAYSVSGDSQCQVLTPMG